MSITFVLFFLPTRRRAFNHVVESLLDHFSQTLFDILFYNQFLQSLFSINCFNHFFKYCFEPRFCINLLKHFSETVAQTTDSKTLQTDAKNTQPQTKHKIVCLFVFAVCLWLCSFVFVCFFFDFIFQSLLTHCAQSFFQSLLQTTFLSQFV